MLILKQRLVKKGVYYYSIHFKKTKTDFSFFMDEMILKTFVHMPNDGKVYYPNHVNGNRTQNTLDNLVWGLEKEKMIYKYFLENLQDEKWKQMYGYPKYEISNMGRIKNQRNEII